MLNTQNLGEYEASAKTQIDQNMYSDVSAVLNNQPKTTVSAISQDIAKFPMINTTSEFSKENSIATPKTTGVLV